jgi:hypothetical protein
MLWRKSLVLKPGEDSSDGKILIRKNRDGELGYVSAFFWPFACRWTERTYEKAQGGGATW